MHIILQCTSKWKYANACSLSSLNWRAITNGELYGYFSSSDTYFQLHFFLCYRVLQTPPCSTVHLFCISFWESVCCNVQFTEEPTSTFYYIRFLLSHQILEDWSQWLAYSVCVCAGAYGMYRLKFYCWKYDNKIGTCKERRATSCSTICSFCTLHAMNRATMLFRHETHTHTIAQKRGDASNCFLINSLFFECHCNNVLRYNWRNFAPDRE